MEEQILPLVSIKCIAYNQVSYIRQCLEGFVMQKTNFKFEAIIMDDASTDGTQDIIREFEEKYPTIIKPIYLKENLFGTGKKKEIWKAKLKGEYVAVCEGDDFWTDPFKLQKQIDFLEAHPEFNLCTCKYDIKYEESGKIVTFPTFVGNVEYDITSYNKSLGKRRNVCRMLTVVYRRRVYDNFDYGVFNPPRIDMLLYYGLLLDGKGIMLDFVGAVYRVSNQGISSTGDMRKKTKFHLKIISSNLKIFKTLPNNEGLLAYAMAYIGNNLWFLWRNPIKNKEEIRKMEKLYQKLFDKSIYSLYMNLIQRLLCYLKRMMFYRLLATK